MLVHEILNNINTLDSETTLYLIGESFMKDKFTLRKFDNLINALVGNKLNFIIFANDYTFKTRTFKHFEKEHAILFKGYSDDIADYCEKEGITYTIVSI